MDGRQEQGDARTYRTLFLSDAQNSRVAAHGIKPVNRL